MTKAPSADFIDYLAVKKTVDNRALNRAVWQRLKTCLPVTAPERPLRVIELGGGIGTMLERVMEWELAAHLDYTLTDLDPAHVDAFRSRIVHWGEQEGRLLEHETGGAVRIRHPGGECLARAVTEDLTMTIERFGQMRQWDLLLAHALLDLVDVDEVLPGCCGLVRPGGLLYLSLIFNGTTEFLPPWQDGFEKEMLDRYHRSMDERRFRGRPAGSSRAGSLVFRKLREIELPILAAGSSDWIVFGQKGGTPGIEAAFLKAIIETIRQELHRDSSLDQGRLTDWVDQRRSQAMSGELAYLARNLDVLARVTF
mgnify:FL=1